MKKDIYICLCGSWATAHNALVHIKPKLPPGATAIVNPSRKPPFAVLEVEVPEGFDIRSISPMAFSKVGVTE